jgi:pilus assembly protein Flp/PilA
MSKIAAQLRSFARDEEAATMPEYALLVALIAVFCIVAVGAIGTQASLKFAALAAAIGA